jgi:hypothetical protein
MVGRLGRLAVIGVLAVVPPAASLSAQQRTITAAEIQLLQDGVLDASTEISRLRARDTTRAAQLERELDEIREDVVYLRALLRREGRVPPADYDEIQNRLNTLRQSARSGLTGVIASAPAAGPNDVPVGTEIDVRLQSNLSSSTAQVEDRFEATTVLNLDDAERILVPAGSVLCGIVSSVDRAGRTARVASPSASTKLPFGDAAIRSERRSPRRSRAKGFAVKPGASAPAPVSGQSSGASSVGSEVC